MSVAKIEIPNMREVKVDLSARQDTQLVLNLPEHGYDDPFILFGVTPVVEVKVWCSALEARWLSADDFITRFKTARVGGLSTLWFRNEGEAALLDFRVGGTFAPPPDGEALVQATAAWYRSNVWRGLTWLGVPVLKCPHDLWIAQEIITAIRPDVILETGTFHGGSAAFYALVLDGIESEGRVISIDIDARSKPSHPKITYAAGSSTDPAIVDRVTSICRGKKVLIFLDSDHSKAHVLAELRAYAPLVQPGSYVVVEDTNFPGPAEAVDEFLSSPAGRGFVRDRTCERLGVTLNPGGWLRKAHGL